MMDYKTKLLLAQRFPRRLVLYVDSPTVVRRILETLKHASREGLAAVPDVTQ